MVVMHAVVHCGELVNSCMFFLEMGFAVMDRKSRAEIAMLLAVDIDCSFIWTRGEAYG